MPKLYITARRTLGEDFINPEDLIRVRPIVDNVTYLEKLQATVPNYRILPQLYHDNYLVVPGPSMPLTIQDLIAEGRVNFPEWIQREWPRFAKKETVGPGWLVFRNCFLEPDPTFGDYASRLPYLPKGERIPSAVEIVWILSSFALLRGYRRVTTITFFSSSTATFAARKEKKLHIGVGYHREQCLIFPVEPDCLPRRNITLASIRPRPQHKP